MVTATTWVLVALFAQEQTPEQLIQLLRSDRIEDRDTAAKGLRALGEKVVPLLLNVEKDGDAEVARRATELIKDIKDPLWREGAEETFRSMEEQIRKARSISVRLKQGYEQSNRPADLRSLPYTTIKLKGEGRMWVGYPDSPKKNRRVLSVSDGKASWPPSPPGLPDSKETTKCMILGFTRLGTGIAMMLTMPAQGREPDDKASLSEFSLAGQDSVGRIISYRITFNVSGITSEKVEVKLWCDPRSRMPKKRIVSIGGGDTLQKFIEIYEDWNLDSGIPDETFALPTHEPPKDEFYRNQDVVEPNQVFGMHGPQGVECVEGIIQKGTLSYDGRGHYSGRCSEFVNEMKECGWTSVPDKTKVADGHAVLRKDDRMCIAEFSGSASDYRATIRVEGSK